MVPPARARSETESETDKQAEAVLFSEPLGKAAGFGKLSPSYSNRDGGVGTLGHVPDDDLLSCRALVMSISAEETVRVGRFWFPRGAVHPRQERRLHEICHYFDDNVLDRLLVPVAKQTYGISLRLLDYTMTNWAKKTRVMTFMKTNSGPIPLNVFSLYKDWLRFYRRRGFDPFRRRERIFFKTPDDSEVLDTTVAQLNFLRWADINGILDYVHENKAQIEEDMLWTLGESKRRRQTSRSQGPSQGQAETAKALDLCEEEQNSSSEALVVTESAPKRRKRIELSQSPATKCVVYPIEQEIRFTLDAAI